MWKEWRENVKWAVLPGLFLLLPMILFGHPDEPMSRGGATYFYLIAAVFGTALGFLQVFFEAKGDKRSLLLHRPISRSTIFLGKALAGVGLYLLALGIPVLCIQAWMATPGNMPAPYDWRTGLPWLAEMLAGLVYYFAGMLTAQREARWYGSRALALAAALWCTLLIWCVPEFWHALVVILTAGTLMGVAAWGSFLAGGAYAPQPRLARAALAGILLASLFTVSFIGKLALGGWYRTGNIELGYILDRQGRVLILPWKEGVGPVEPLTDLEGHVPADLQGRRVDRNLVDEVEAPLAGMGWARHRSYRNPGRFYVEYLNDSRPGRERWYYVPEHGRLLGYDMDYHQFLGSYGPDGFAAAGAAADPLRNVGTGMPAQHFQGQLGYVTRFWDAIPPSYLAFPGGVYDVDFSRHTIRRLFTPPASETVLRASRWRDRREKSSLAIVSTERSIHVLTPAGAAVVSLPRVFDREKYRLASVGRLDDPLRYVVWYRPQEFLGREEWTTAASQLLEYDATGREISRRTLPRPAAVEQSYSQALFGLATPPAELASVLPASWFLRSVARSTGNTERWVLLEFLEMSIRAIPESVWSMETSDGLFRAFVGLTLLSAAACALVCFLLARRYAFSRARCIAWALCGFIFGWTGLALMLVLADWPARICCPSCQRRRRVDLDACEHCGAAHAVPALDGTEIFEATAAPPQGVLAAR
jgi:hypothetical protein